MRDSIKQLINGYEFTTTQQPVVKQTIETIRNLTNALFTIGKVDAPFQDTDAEYIEKHLGWSYETPTHVKLVIK